MGILFSLQTPLYFLVHYSNYIYTLFVLLFYFSYWLVIKLKGLWPLWVLYMGGVIWFYLFPGSLFFMIRGYNLIVTGNWFFLHI